MVDDNINTIWNLLNEKRDTFRGFESILEIANENNIELTVEDIRSLSKRFSPRDSVFSCPGFVVDFIQCYLSKHEINSILDPWAGFGSLLIPLVRDLQIKIATGIDLNELNLKVARTVDTAKEINWLHGDPLTQLNQLKDSFDAVISSPPVGLKMTEISLSYKGNEFNVRDHMDKLIVLKACLLLKDTGIGIFVVAPNLLFEKRRANGVLATLTRFGFSIEAVLQIPAGAFAPLTSISFPLLIIRKGKNKDIFVGQLSENQERNSVLLNNLMSKKEGEDVSLGRIVKLSEFDGFQTLVAEEKLSSTAKRMGLVSIPIQDIILEINAIKATDKENFKSQSNTVYLPKIGRSKAVTSIDDLSLKPHNYLQLVINTEKANPQYVAEFFNSPLGHMVRETANSGVTIPKISKSNLSKTFLYLPSYNFQIKALEAGLKTETLIQELEELHDKIWSYPLRINRTIEEIEKVNREERFEDWLDTLPFPLASILWTYHAVETDRRKYEQLDHFFEALALFMATLSLSSFSNDEVRFEKEKQVINTQLAKTNLSYKIASFGTWLIIYERLAKQARIMLDPKEGNPSHCKKLYRTLDDEVLNMLISKEIVTLLREANILRNDWRGHGGLISDRKAHNLLLAFQGLLSRLRQVFGNIWLRYELIVPRGMIFSDSVFNVTANRLMGSRTPFTTVRILSNEPMEDGSLYCMGQDERVALQLMPLFKIMPSPETAQNACYFYNRQDEEGLRMVSYHFDEESEIRNEFADTKQALDSLMKISKDII